MTDTQHQQLTRVNQELAQVRAALSDRRVGLIASKRLYNRLGALLRELDSLTKDTNDHDNRQ